MPSKYQIRPLVWLIKDEDSVKFHVKSDDYFGTIATILSLLKQNLKTAAKEATVFNKTFNNLEKDLLFLQKNYQINPKTKNMKSKPKGKLKSQ